MDSWSMIGRTVGWLGLGRLKEERIVPDVNFSCDDIESSTLHQLKVQYRPSSQDVFRDGPNRLERATGTEKTSESQNRP